MNWNTDYSSERERLRDDLERAGLHQELVAAVYFNAGAGLELHELRGATVVLYIDGANDEDPWHWIIQLATGEWRYVEGWCDYTGWDCQSGITVHRAEDLDHAIRLCADDERRAFTELLAAKAVQP